MKALLQIEKIFVIAGVLWTIIAFTSCNNQNATMPSADPAAVSSSAEGTKAVVDSGMVWLEGGSFQMGAEDPAFADAQPVHAVNVSGFWMDEHEVTNSEFAKFISATHYKTVAEKQLDPQDYPGVKPENLLPGSGVFTPPSDAVSLDNSLQWWQYVAGASWDHPKGPQSTIAGIENYPVVQVCYEDALAYASWSGKRLPTEAEWEYAARAGSGQSAYYWGNSLKPGNKWPANIYQGDFPYRDKAEDGYAGVAPIKSFAPNAFGLYDMEGNVWEWCSDFYTPDYYAQSPASNPRGPANSFDPQEPGIIKRVQRGGSFICSDEYCNRYKAGARGKGEVTSASNNLGFRCVKDGPKPK